MKKNHEYALLFAGTQLTIQFFLLQQLLTRLLPDQTALIYIFNILFVALILGGSVNKNSSFTKQILDLAPFQILIQLILVLILPALSVYFDSLFTGHFNSLPSILVNSIMLVLIGLSSTAALSASIRPGSAKSNSSTDFLSVLTGILLGLLMIVLLINQSIQLYLLFYTSVSAALLATLRASRPAIIRFSGVCLVIIAIFPLLNRQVCDWSYGAKYAPLGAGAVEPYKYTVTSKYDLLPVGGHDKLLLVNGIIETSLAEVQRDQDLLLTYAGSFLYSPKVCMINQPYIPETDSIPESIYLVHEDRNIPDAFARSLSSRRIPDRNFIRTKPARFIQQREFKYDLVINNYANQNFYQQLGTNSTRLIENLPYLVGHGGILAVKLPKYGGTSVNRFILDQLAAGFKYYFAIQLRGALYFYAGNRLTVADDEYRLRQGLPSRYRNQGKLYTKNQVDRHFLGITE